MSGAPHFLALAYMTAHELHPFWDHILPILSTYPTFLPYLTAFKKNLWTWIFFSNFRLTEKLFKKCSCLLHSCIAPSHNLLYYSFPVLYWCGTLVEFFSPYWYIILIKVFTLGFTLCVGFNKWIIISTITIALKLSITLKVPCALLIHPSMSLPVTDLFSFFVVLPSLQCHIIGIVRFAVFSDWLVLVI
jgi:hypothetical protein